MTERILAENEKAYKNMEAVAKILEAVSEHGATYEVGDTYLDYGQGWMWTTIIRRGYAECQVLNPNEWKHIAQAETLVDIMDCAVRVKTGFYFQD